MYVCTYIRVCVCVYVCVCKHACIYLRTCECIIIFMCVFVCVCVCLCMCTCVCIYMCMYIHQCSPQKKRLSGMGFCVDGGSFNSNSTKRCNFGHFYINKWMATCLVSLALVGFIRSIIITYVASLGQWYCYYSITIIICIN